MSRMSLNGSNQTVNFGYGVATYLSKTEFKLLKVLHDNEGALVDRNGVLISIGVRQLFGMQEAWMFIFVS